MTVIGRDLDSVAEPRITLTVVITRFDNDNMSASATSNSEVLVVNIFTFTMSNYVKLNVNDRKNNNEVDLL